MRGRGGAGRAVRHPLTRFDPVRAEGMVWSGWQHGVWPWQVHMVLLPYLRWTRSFMTSSSTNLEVPCGKHWSTPGRAFTRVGYVGRAELCFFFFLMEVDVNGARHSSQACIRRNMPGAPVGYVLPTNITLFCELQFTHRRFL